jgi:hypothetical protein
MTALLEARAVWTRGRTVERAAYVTAAVLTASGLVHLVVLLATGATWEGPLSYRKAMTFGLSFGLTLASLAWAQSFLTVRRRAALLGAFTAVSLVEVALVTLQVWRGRPSHFDFETGFDTVVSYSLAAGGGVIIVTVLGFAVAALKSTDLSPSMTLALRFGLVVLFAAMVVGAIMIADGVGLARGGQPQLAYTTAGSLKPVHAVTMHAVVVVPGLAWLLRNAPERRRVRAIQAAAALYTLAIAGAIVVS